ncbi:threonine--tRNA ligase [Candidatus Woesearchaeota archaeon]|nr:threonine--tRNA ligase [Candidatus Woesearchaeota archaeon]MBW3005330.1 threonine--tRNA ligase [Candidatus Woesearchaeota archaeon]
MKILALHSDFIEFKPEKKALKDAEKVDKKPVHVDECLVILSSVEKRDESNAKAVVKRLVEEIESVAGQVKAKNVVLYPYVHLSASPASPAKALSVLKDAEKALKKKFKVTRAPFGWYKSFDIKCKGHPLSELSREFTAEGEEKEDVSRALKAEAKAVSKWFILDEKGKLHELKIEKNKIAGFDFKKHENLRKFAEYELQKVRVAKGEPPHVNYMKKLELVDYEPGSDPGNLRFYPKGRMIKSLLERFVTGKVKEYGGMEVETPIMYDFEHPALKSYLNRFPARQYTIQTPNKRVFLRFAACFGQFLMAHDMGISYKDLPLKLYELSRYSFRVEQHGELTGLRRLRAFTMPDCHAFCADVGQARDEMLVRFDMCTSVLDNIGLKIPDELEMDVRIVKGFWEKNKEYVKSLVKRWGRPALVEMHDEQYAYFLMKYSWNFVDVLGKAAALTTDQIDVENARQYDITYVDKHSKKQNPIILHCSPSGAIERVMWVLLERAHFMEKAGKPPMLPVWLSPSQVRIIPVSSENHFKFAENLAQEFKKEDIRADIDDREESVGKRIRQSATEWVPYTLVVGDKEAGEDKLMVRVRKTGKEIKMSKKDLIKEIKSEIKDMPFEPVPENVLLSKRPIFVG